VIGLYPEIKHSSYFRSIALPLEPAVLQTLQRYGLNHKDAPVYIQSFEISNLKALRAQTPVRLVQLIEESGLPADQMLLPPGEDPVSYSSMITPAGLNQVRSYADGIGPYKRLILPDAGGRLMPPTALVNDAHAVGLQVHPWTFRSDESYLHENHFGDPSAEYAAFFDAGVDGIFSDFTAHAVAARTGWLASRAPSEQAAVRP
jgi:glycerophosphoryl diester phosphodiesterase